MTTNSFKITYANGKTTEMNSSDASADELCMSTFGMTLDEAAENGCNVELLGEFVPVEADDEVDETDEAVEADTPVGDESGIEMDVETHAPSIDQTTDAPTE